MRINTYKDGTQALSQKSLPQWARTAMARAAAAFGLAIAFSGAIPLAAQAQTAIPAFPGAVGYGAAATGGRGGTVYHVTNLNDSGTGSFRDAVSASNRIIVFDVGGYVVLKSPVSVKSNLTIAGQTAPGDGFGIMGNETSFSNSSNIICRRLRFRQGDLDTDSNHSGINLLNVTNAIFDHISIEFAQWNNIDAVNCHNITVQNSIDADPIGQQFNAHTETVGGFFTWYNNIFASAHNRNPLAKINTQYINNVIYNFQAGYTDGNTSTRFSHDIINNYFITGPSTSSAGDAFYQIGSANQTIYASGNMEDSSHDGALNGSLMGNPDSSPATAPFAATTSTIFTRSAANAYAYVVAHAGALPHDEVDSDVIADLTSLGTRGRMWTHQTSNGLDNTGYGTLDGGAALPDTDGDGIPDAWEQKYGLDPYDASDANKDFDGTGYTNLEKYINSLVDGSYPIGSQVPVAGKYNGVGITNDGTTYTGGVDGSGYAYSSSYLNQHLTSNQHTYALGSPGAANIIRTLGQTLTMPAGKYTHLTFLGAATRGSQPNQKFTVRYADGSSSALIQGMSDWMTPQSYTGESVATTPAYRNFSTGSSPLGLSYLYQYDLPLDGTKTLRNLTLPNNPGLVVLGMDLVEAVVLVVPGHLYKLVPVNAVDKGAGGVDEVLDVAGGSSASPTPVDISSATGGTGQQWAVTDMGGGYYRLTPQCAPGNALDVPNGTTRNATAVDSAAWTGGSGQLWQINDLGNGSGRIVPKCDVDAGLLGALDVAGNKSADGTLIDVYQTSTGVGGTNEQWRLIRLN